MKCLRKVKLSLFAKDNLTLKNLVVTVGRILKRVSPDNMAGLKENSLSPLSAFLGLQA